MKRSGTRLLISMGITILVCVILGTVGMLIYLKISFRPYTVSVSMGEEAAAKALIWLSEVEGNTLGYEDVRELMGDLYVEVNMTPTEVRGVYSQSLDEDSYDACSLMAKEGLKKAFCQVTLDLLVAEGYEGEPDEVLVEQLMQDTFGVSVEEYLDSCGVELIPSFENLSEKYSQEVSNEKN